MALKGTNKDVRTIGRELGVRFIVEGSVRRAASRLGISARLIDASTDDHVWAEKYDGMVEDVFTMQERLARTIVDALQLQLTAEEHQQLAARPISNVHAYECYLQARQAAFRWRQDAIDHAVQLLHNGLAIVGDNAELYAALGRTYLQYREAAIDLSDRPLREAENCAERVSALDPRSASGTQLRGWIHYSNGRIQEAVRDLKAAHAIDPNNPDTLALLSNCYLISGKVPFARPLIDQLLAVDPLTPLTRCMPGFADLMEGNLASAIAPYRQMIEMDPGNPMTRLFYAGILALNGRSSEVTAIAESVPSSVKDTIPARLTSFLAHALAGNRSAALAMLTPEIEAIAHATDVLPRFLAHGYAAAGMPDRAIQWLSIAVDRGFINYTFLAHHDPLLNPLRTHARFRQLLETVRERWEEFEP
jgi:tetratricopeptide (TPR) repeat protein